MVRIYAVRHGLTPYNEIKKIQGTTDVPLSQEGIAQAQESRDMFADQGIHFEEVWSSPLQRALQTAEIITGRSRENFTLDSRLREIECGVMSGHLQTEDDERIYNFTHHPQLYVPSEGAESFEELRDRAADFLRFFAGDYQAREDWKAARRGAGADTPCVLFSSHAGLLHAMAMALDPSITVEDFWKLPLANGSALVIELENGHFTFKGVMHRKSVTAEALARYF